MKTPWFIFPLALCIVTGVCRAEDTSWARFRGPNGSGRGVATNLPASFTPDDYDWQVTVPGRGYSSPVVWENRIILTTEQEKSGLRRVLCLDTEDGRTLWSWEQDFEAHARHRDNSFASSTPCVDTEGIYLLTSSGTRLSAVALDHSGGTLWEKDLGAFSKDHGSAVSPIVVSNVLVVGNEGSHEGAFLSGLDTRTGRVMWTRTRSASRKVPYSTPVVYRPRSGVAEIVFTQTAQGMTSLDPFTGAVNWEKTGLFKDRTVGSPIVHAGLIVGTGGSGNGERQLAALLPRRRAGRIEPLVKYSIANPSTGVPTPLAVGSLLFLLHNQGYMSCLNVHTGERHWKARVPGQYYASPVYGDGKVYALNREGQLVVLAAEKDFRILAENTLPEGGHATPAIAGGCLYVRTYRHLVRVGPTRSPAGSGPGR